MEFRDMIYMKRRKKNWTQQKLAKKMGVSRMTIIRWESGKYKPRGVKMLRLIETLCITRQEAEKI